MPCRYNNSITSICWVFHYHLKLARSKRFQVVKRGDILSSVNEHVVVWLVWHMRCFKKKKKVTKIKIIWRLNKYVKINCVGLCVFFNLVNDDWYRHVIIVIISHCLPLFTHVHLHLLGEPIDRMQHIQFLGVWNFPTFTHSSAWCTTVVRAVHCHSLRSPKLSTEL